MSGKSLQYSRVLSHAYSYWWWMNKDFCISHCFYFNYYLVHWLLYICLSGLYFDLTLVGHMYQEFIFLLGFPDFWKYKFPKHSLMNLCFFSVEFVLTPPFFFKEPTLWLNLCIIIFSINFFHDLHYFLTSDAFWLEFVLFLQWLTGPLENVLFNLHLFV